MTRPPIDQQIMVLYTHDLAATACFYEEALGVVTLEIESVMRGLNNK